MLFYKAVFPDKSDFLIFPSMSSKYALAGMTVYYVSVVPAT